MSHNCAECDCDRSRSAVTPGGVGCGWIFLTIWLWWQSSYCPGLIHKTLRRKTPPHWTTGPILRHLLEPLKRSSITTEWFNVKGSFTWLACWQVIALESLAEKSILWSFLQKTGPSEYNQPSVTCWNFAELVIFFISSLHKLIFLTLRLV